MKTKAYTDFEQAKTLLDFLPIETSDMFWDRWVGAESYKWEIHVRQIPNWKDRSTQLDYMVCWSLDALMELLPETITVVDKEDEEDYTDYILCIIKEDGQWTIYYEEEAHSALTTERLVDKTSENLIDAAYNVIVELHSRELL